MARSNLILGTLAMLGALATPAAADYESAVAAYQSGAYDKAIGEFVRLTEEGDERANFYLGMMHKDGKGTVANYLGSSSSSPPSGRIEFGKSPKPEMFLLQIFYFPARVTIKGVVVLAELFDFDALVIDLRHLANLRNDLFIALFALFWWFLMIKGLLRVCLRGVGST